jgi:hypothetical protein
MLNWFRRSWRSLLVLPVMALILSGVVTWINVGFSSDFMSRWLHSLASAIPVIFFGFLMLGPLARAVHRIFASLHVITRKVILAILTACMMELLVATAVTLANFGLANNFFAVWMVAFLKSLPVGICIGHLMVFFVKPRLDRMTAAAMARDVTRAGRVAM